LQGKFARLSGVTTALLLSSSNEGGMAMFTITPIGTVRNEVKTPIVKGWGRVVSDLVLDERYTEALDGLEDFSHVLVIF
jgi:tRNA (Thr-GGU) A37 N-methylase